jgi:hypothetical protein
VTGRTTLVEIEALITIGRTLAGRVCRNNSWAPASPQDHALLSNRKATGAKQPGAARGPHLKMPEPRFECCSMLPTK